MRAIITFFLLSIIGQSFAQEVKPRNWLLPDFVTLQYAGSIGFVSLGTGYATLQDRINIEVLFGVVPRFTGSEPMETITMKFTGSIIRTRLNEKITLTPLTAGLYFCYTPGKEFSSDLPSWYPDGYYWWSEAVRVNIFIGGNIAGVTNKLGRPRKISAYYEIGTNEIKLVSYVQNGQTLSFWSILHAGVGVKYYFAE
jgi:hypothetical protein